MKAISTARLTLRPFSEDDAAFVLELLNDPDWLRFIGDNGVRTREDARGYLRDGPLAMYARFGLGLLCVEPKDGGEAMGMCGLIRREGVADVDIGFAFLPAFRSRGFAREAASSTLAHGHESLGIRRIVAYTARDNSPSARLLADIGMRLERTTTLPHSPEELLLFASGTGAE